jgi:hypothetical protein
MRPLRYRLPCRGHEHATPESWPNDSFESDEQPLGQPEMNLMICPVRKAGDNDKVMNQRAARAHTVSRAEAMIRFKGRFGP